MTTRYENLVNKLAEKQKDNEDREKFNKNFERLLRKVFEEDFLQYLGYTGSEKLVRLDHFEINENRKFSFEINVAIKYDFSLRNLPPGKANHKINGGFENEKSFIMLTLEKLWIDKDIEKAFDLICNKIIP